MTISQIVDRSLGHMIPDGELPDSPYEARNGRRLLTSTSTNCKLSANCYFPHVVLMTSTILDSWCILRLEPVLSTSLEVT